MRNSKFKIQNPNKFQISNFKFVIGILLVIGHWSLVITAPAVASYISLNTTLASKVENNNLKVMVSVINKGDESAYNVQAEFRFGQKVILAEKKTELPVNSSYQAQATIPIPKMTKPGTYPLVLVMHYTDANQYPFSALTCQTFVFQKEAVSPLFGQIKPATFSVAGKLHFTVRNFSNEEIKTKTYLVAPRELTVVEENLQLIIPPKSEQSSTFNVKNFSALSGSTYQVFAISEFEDQGLHYTIIAPGTVKIIEDKALWGVNLNLLISILAVLLIIFVAAQFFRREK